MPTPIDGLGATAAIASLIRRAMAERAQSRQRSSSSSSASKNGKTQGSKGRARQTPLADVIAARVEELDPDAPDFRARMLRLVIEAALLQQFGHALINAPKFQGMVDQIVHDLQAAPQLQPDLAAVLEGLAGGGQGNAFTA
ncbi:MAG: hypothetical protein EOP36_11035 [Rubrivivax sp.]|nr:MAG: hypothetical protein EOP36_11035 [Rubrivivax sp.]